MTKLNTVRTLVLILLLASCAKNTSTQTANNPNPADTTTTKPPSPPAPPVVAKKWMVSTLAGSSLPGFTDGDSTQAQFGFTNSMGIFADNHGSLWVADQGNFSIRQVTTAGHVTTYAGRNIGTPNPTFGNIFGLVRDATGNLFTTEGPYIRKIESPTNSYIFAGSMTLSFADGTGTNARFNILGTIAIDRQGNMFLPDYNMHDSIHIRKVTPAGVVTTLALQDNTGFPSNGLPNSHYLYSIAVDSSGNLYLTANGNCMIKKIDPAGNVSILAGAGNIGFTDGKGQAAQFNTIIGLACDPSGNLWVCDSDNHSIRKVTPDGTVTTIAGKGSLGFSDGDSTQALFRFPGGITVDNTGTVFVMDNGNNRIRKLEYK